MKPRSQELVRLEELRPKLQLKVPEANRTFLGMDINHFLKAPELPIFGCKDCSSNGGGDGGGPRS